MKYFNHFGAHESGLIWEGPKGLPNNLIPYMAKMVVRILPAIKIYGNDYDTPDATEICDYIHVMNIALDRVSTLVCANHNNGIDFCNLGTGSGFNVKDMIHILEGVSSQKINIDIVNRRSGDISDCYASVRKANQL